MDAEHAATLKPHATTAMTLLIDNPTDIYAASSRDLAPQLPPWLLRLKSWLEVWHQWCGAMAGFAFFKAFVRTKLLALII
jgi:hypothetical protein